MARRSNSARLRQGSRSRAANSPRIPTRRAPRGLRAAPPDTCKRGWRRRCWARSRPASSTRTSGGSARSACSGASAGRGGEFRDAGGPRARARRRRRRVVRDGGGHDSAGDSEIGESEGERLREGLRLEEVRGKREERYGRYVRPLDRKRDVMAVEVDRRMRALTGTQQAEARRILGAINGSDTFKHRTE